MVSKVTKSSKYGDGPREQYGEGVEYRAEDKTAAADNMGENMAFGSGGSKHDRGATSRKIAERAPKRSSDEEANDAQRSTPKGSGHETAKGGLPEKQPSQRDQ